MRRFAARTALRGLPAAAVGQVRLCTQHGPEEGSGFGGLGHTIPGGEAAVPIGKDGAKVKVTQGDLDLGASMPPLLQYNDELVGVALELVELANGTSGDPSAPVLGEAEQEAVANVIAMLFNEGFVSAVDQYDTVRELQRVERLRGIPAVQRAMHRLLAALIPRPLSYVVQHMDSSAQPATPEQEQLLERLVVLILEGQEDDDSFVAALKDIELSFPALFTSTAFVSLLQNMNDVLLQCRFAFLINEACLAFDPEGTGKVQLTELRESLEKVIPKEAAARMMAGVEANDDGSVYYPQMAQVFMQGIHN